MAIITSIFGIGFALLGFSNYLFDFLNFLGILAPAISAIYSINFFFVKKQRYDLEDIPEWDIDALVSWGLSSGITIFTYLGIFQLTHVYCIDSLLLGAITYVFLKRKFIWSIQAQNR